MKLLMDLSNHECKYPLKEDREVVGHFYFCAEAKSSESPYCDKHAKTCATPPSHRRISRAY
jgi:hypothetical protein